ncbi:ORF6N domain-containing protein [Sphingobacterium sp. SGR-19]|uniref:ORF6N domain-containing protein n=1 Tax=Sphingobacterium sp. SGR-19 TaxID=2710886 RepID=UPI0013EB6550|nr:ORF6N domain-containing protein [Sphingobacterium sp. SGR-19]NGM66859.1 ORF6N domain-containing protein [Sphingobacterium sp. SGR-19]
MSKTKTEIKAVAIADDVLANKIYEFRGQKVILDSDLAELYGVETKQLKRQVRRNIDRFPEDFMFELTKQELEILRSQLGTLRHGEHTKYAPMVFTEHGVLMLSSVLNSKQAIAINIQIMRVFTKLRQFLTDNSRIQHELTEMKLAIEKLSKKQKGHDQNIELLFEYIDRLQENAPHASSKGVTVVKGFDIGSKKNN